MYFFNTELIIERLKETQFQFELVEGAAEFEAVTSLASFRPGSLYVVLMREQNPAGNGAQAQRKTAAIATFGVIVAARNYRGNRGAEALKDAVPIISRMRQALLGWPPAGCTPCIWHQGDVLDKDKQNLLWADVFSTTHVIGA